jgi:hypothetical protein
MRSPITTPCAVLIFASMLVLTQLALAQSDSITVELKTFKFKVKEDVTSLFGLDEGDTRLFFYTNGSAEATIKVPADGDYELVIRASCDPAQNERAKFRAALDGETVGKETLLTADEAKEYKLTMKAKSGERKLAIAFTNDVYKENEYDRNFYVHAVSFQRVKPEADK